MIRSITIRNFQSHADTRLDLSPGINVILGPSNMGKTAIIRALQWVRLNRPLGTAFIRDGESGASVVVELVTQAGKTVEVCRVRDSRRNDYVVNGSASTAPSKDVPDEVTQAFGINELNLQLQTDGPFGVLDSPGAVAGKISEVTGLNGIDGAVASLTSRIRSDTNELDRLKSEVERLRGRIEGPEFAGLKLLRTLTDTWAGQERLRTAKVEARSKLQSLLCQARTLEESIRLLRVPSGIPGRIEDARKRCSELLVRRNRSCELVDGLLSEACKWNELEGSRSRLRVPAGLEEHLWSVADLCARALSRREVVAKALCTLRLMITAHNDVSVQLRRTLLPAGAQGLGPLRQRLDDLLRERAVDCSSRLALNDLILACRARARQVDLLTTDLAVAREKLVGALRSVRICPVCKSSLDESGVARMLEGIGGCLCGSS